MSDPDSTPQSTGSPMSMEVLTPRIDALRSSLSKDFEKSGNRKGGSKVSIEGKDRDHRRALVEGLVTARRQEKPRRSANASGGGFVPLADFESFKRTIEMRVQALEEALEQKDDEIDALQKQLEAGGSSQAPQPAQAEVAEPAKRSPVKPMTGIPALNLSTPSSPGAKRPPKAPPSPIASPTTSSPKQAAVMPTSTLTLDIGQWEPDDVALVLGQLGVFKLWTASMVCRQWRHVACTVVLQQKREQLRAGADAGMQHYKSNPEDTDGLMKLLPPLFQAGGPYHTLGMLGFVKIQELLQNDELQLKDLYKFMRDITRRK